MIWENNPDIRLEHCANRPRAIQQVLNACREERRPYVIITDTMSPLPTTPLPSTPLPSTPLPSTPLPTTPELSNLVVPVSMLEEEVYKAEICTYLARKTGVHIILLRAHDYGSKATMNVHKITTHIQSISQKTGVAITYEIRDAKSDSFHLMREAALLANSLEGNTLLVLTASRDYGLDDILFGPQERHAIRRAQVPVMLVNPRGDLFSLCD